MSDQQQLLANDQPYGDRAKNQAAQQARPLKRASMPDVAGGVTRLDKLRGQGQPADDAWMTERPSDYPGEPVTSGAPTGPGPGPESLESFRPETPREQILAALAEGRWGQPPNAEAKAMLDQLRTPAASPSPQPIPRPGAGGGGSSDMEPL